VWTPYNRTVIPEDHPSRIKYVESFVNTPAAVQEEGDAKRQKVEGESKVENA
jgi:hypothetical protein